MNQSSRHEAINETKFGFEGSKNLKQKILTRQDELRCLKQKMDVHRNNTDEMEQRQEELSNMLAQKCDTMKEHLEEKFEKIEQDMKKHFAQ